MSYSGSSSQFDDHDEKDDGIMVLMVMIINMQLTYFAVQNSASICFSMTKSFGIIWDLFGIWDLKSV